MVSPVCGPPRRRAPPLVERDGATEWPIKKGEAVVLLA